MNYCPTGRQRVLERFGVVFVGADEAVFRPTPPMNERPDVVVSYGTFIPLDGTEWIVREAALVQDRGYRIQIIGKGQNSEAVMQLAEELGTENVQFVDPVSKSRLMDEVAAAGLCLRIFGTSQRANRVIPHKVCEALAYGHAVLTGATDAIHETLSSDELAFRPVGDFSLEPQSNGSRATDGDSVIEETQQSRPPANRLEKGAQRRDSGESPVRPAANRLRANLDVGTGGLEA